MSRATALLFLQHVNPHTSFVVAAFALALLFSWERSAAIWSIRFQSLIGNCSANWLSTLCGWSEEASAGMSRSGGGIDIYLVHPLRRIYVAHQNGHTIAFVSVR